MRDARGRYVKVADRLMDAEYEDTIDGTLHVQIAVHEGNEFYVLRVYRKYGSLPRRNIMSFEELVSTFPEWRPQLENIRDEMLAPINP